MSEEKTHPVIVVHGGAWAIPEHLTEASLAGVQRAASTGFAILRNNGTAVDAVEAAVRVLEDDPAFDAGRGSVLNANGEIEMDAMIMDGRDLRAGSVAAVQNIANPVSLARRVMEKTEHTMLVGKGANQFAVEEGIQEVSPDSLVSQEARDEFEQIMKFKTAINVSFSSRMSNESGHDTVGAVALDCHGNLACATSTGGITAKKPGRVGDSPLIGSGGYADNKVGAVSTTGHGEAITKVCLARTVLFYIQQGMTPQKAADKALSYMTSRVQGSGGAIVVDKEGRTGCYHTTQRMAWASLTASNGLSYGIDPGKIFKGSLEN